MPALWFFRGTLRQILVRDLAARHERDENDRGLARSTAKGCILELTRLHAGETVGSDDHGVMRVKQSWRRLYT